MKKIVLKTASITLAAIIAVALIVYGVFALFFPYNLASFYRGVSNYGLALKYSERGYLKSDDHALSDLLIVVYDAIGAENDEKIEKYAARSLMSDELTQSERLHVSQKYCLALYNRGKKDSALEKAADLTCGGALCTGYVTGNPFRAVMGAAVESVSNELKSGKGVSSKLTEYIKKIQSALSGMQSDEMPSEQKYLLNGDLKMINELCARIENENIKNPQDSQAGARSA